VRHHRDPVDAEQRCTAELSPVHAAAQPLNAVTDERTAHLALERGVESPRAGFGTEKSAVASAILMAMLPTKPSATTTSALPA